MKPLSSFGNGYVFYNEQDIHLREYVILTFENTLRSRFRDLNQAIGFYRIETPILTPQEFLKGHQIFELWAADEKFLRPETTVGTYKAFEELKQKMPVCIWQAGKVFRIEQDRPFNEVRFKEFYQLEFQLFYSKDSKANYFAAAIENVLKTFADLGLGVQLVTVTNPAHYAERTVDFMFGDMELGNVSLRHDYTCPVVEMSLGLDRICRSMR